MSYQVHCTRFYSLNWTNLLESVSPGGQALIKLTGVSYPQVRLEQAAVTMMMVPGDLHFAPDQELVHGAGGGGVEVPSEDHGAVLPRPV